MNPNDAKEALRRGHEAGRWEVEHLDQPSPGRRLQELDLHHEKSILPDSFELPPHRNLLRELFGL